MNYIMKQTAYNLKIRHLGYVVRAPLTLSLRWNGKMSRYRLWSITAGTVSISITKYIAKRKIVHRTKLTIFQNHFTTSGSLVDFILPNFSLFVPFNRVNLWYF